MITVIHGDDIASSRKYLSEEKQRLKHFIVFEGNALNISDLAQNIEGNSLFGDKITVIIENFISKKSKLSDETKKILDFLKKHKDAEIIFWEGKELSKKNAEIVPGAKSKLFKIPQLLFMFLDNIKPNASNSSIALFHEVLENVEVELIFFMLIRQFRLMLGLSDMSSAENIDEVIRLAPWQKEKLERQMRLFPIQKLKKMYRILYEIDIMQKTGKTIFSLIQSIDFLLLEI